MLDCITGAITIFVVYFVLLTQFKRVHEQKKIGINAHLLVRHHILEIVIYPYCLLMAWHVPAYVFGWPTAWGPALNTVLFPWPWINIPAEIIGDILCLIGLWVFIWCIQSFGRAFRLGVDYDNPSPLITTGIYAYCRNPMYVAYDLITLGLFLIHLTPFFFIMGIGCWGIFFRQTTIEEEFLWRRYGKDFEAYCDKVGRFYTLPKK